MFSRLSLIALMLLGLCPTVLANQSENPENVAPWGRVRSLSELRQLPLSKNPQDSLSQINSVDQLRDVQPNVWAYEALKSLVERYGCIVGYPDATFRGDRALSRWEFAAGLNACLNTMEKLLQENVGADF